MLPWLLWPALLARPSLGQQNFTRGQKFQIILLGTPDTSKMPIAPTDAPVWDVDLFDTDASSIKALQAAGKIVICYFSAGTVEDWRDDAKDFPAADVGKVLPEWPDEKWIRVGSQKIRDIMAKRIKTAGDKGCDAIDPDNTDGYQNDNGLNLKDTDAISYVQWMQQEAAKYNMDIGLKNSIDIIDRVSTIVDFAVNEQCAQLGECDRYTTFLATNKPVFHIEYPAPLNTSAARSTLCTGPGTTGMSTVLKNLALDGPTVYCDGSQVDTPTKGGTSPPRPSPSSRPPNPPRPTSTPSRPTSTPPRPTSNPPRPSTTLRPSSTQRPSSTRASSARPTSTPGNPGNPGGGCKSKHWDQCGGQNWNGCTVCESPYTCKGVSPPYYYQCL
ncbi:carbohydrate-binding module family 1 protein [Trematosphaeria pertusa]|uniref:alpha-galactosidase n=1 Tax=Trematosphaeria pertusa TaxID=390896 RepID=A0A6A6ITM7_9PLEO|nr:carbohydrate-binding module family 1 protein [Trematosphaeria pertusa]KAF2253222.1 carbohydrate-binding module family 1 protein [Trematosphaeria pertusa]